MGLGLRYAGCNGEERLHYSLRFYSLVPIGRTDALYLKYVHKDI